MSGAPIFSVGTLLINRPFFTPNSAVLGFGLPKRQAHGLRTSDTCAGWEAVAKTIFSFLSIREGPNGPGTVGVRVFLFYFYSGLLSCPSWPSQRGLRSTVCHVRGTDIREAIPALSLPSSKDTALFLPWGAHQGLFKTHS